jgi:uncharacterized protein (DUF305 family)
VTAGTKAPDSTGKKYTWADVAFVQGMIQHHGQALEMTALISGRTQRQDLASLGERITVSQRDEIAMMSQWLKARGEPVTATPSEHAEHAMPGMLSRAQMDSLRASRGSSFDRLFLRLMIQHHEGALVMVKTLLSVPRAAQEPQLFTFVSDVDTDQRAEIARMQALLDTIRR